MKRHAVLAVVRPDTRAREFRCHAPTVRIALSGPERSRRKRALRAAGLACFTVTVDQARLEETLRLVRNFTEAQLPPA